MAIEGDLFLMVICHIGAGNICRIAIKKGLVPKRDKPGGKDIILLTPFGQKRKVCALAVPKDLLEGQRVR